MRAMPPLEIEADTGTAARPSLLWALIAVSMVSPFAINVVVPSLPAIERHFAADYGTVQLVLSLYLASVAASQVLLGPLSDRFGRRPVLMAGLALFLAASLACIAAPNVESLIGLRVVQAAGGSAGLVLARAIVRDLYERRRAASMIGYLTMGFALAPMLAPLIGGLLQGAFDWRASFWFMAGFGLISLGVAWRGVPETNVAPAERLGLATLFRDFGQLLREPSFLLFTGSAGLSSGVFFAFLGGAPYVSENILHLTPTIYGTWFVLVAGGYAIGNFLSGRYAERAGVRWMIVGGSLLAVVVVALMPALFAAGLDHPASLFGPMFVLGIANGLVLPNALAGAISVVPRIAGAASGLTGAAQMGFGALFSAITGAMLAGGATAMPLFVAMGLAAAGAFGVALAIGRTQAQP
jgi:DHA1 family bicyclomycin/chloramphenicol resistance-like MFS transporter